MPSLKTFRLRIRSVQSTQKITKAMKMVAAAKLRRAQEQAMAARPYAEIRATLERQRKPMENLDMMIAAHALAVEAVLVTNDRSFRRLRKLKLEDWTK